MHRSSVRRALLAACSFLALALPASASADRLVIPGGPTFKTTGSETIAFAGYVYFAADDDVHGNELWRTDGTAAGTTLVKDINVGEANSRSDPKDFVVAGNRLFFQVTTNGTTSQAIYTIDPGGTPQQPTLPAFSGGTPARVAVGSLFGVVNGKAVISSYQVPDPGYPTFGNYYVYALGDTGTVFTQVSTGDFNAAAESGPLSLKNAATLGNYIYFQGVAGGSTSGSGRIGGELYRTDGVSAPTVVKNIRAEVGGTVNSSSPIDFTATDNRVYFTAEDGFTGRELWVSDGTETGTHIVRDHATGTQSGTDGSRAVRGSTLYYVPLDSATGPEVWRTDGTDAGTRVVKDITPGPSGFQSQLFGLGSGLGFFRGNDVYGSDGTDAGTTVLATVGSDGYGPRLPRVVGRYAYFTAGFAPYGSSLWRTDGTAAGTFALTAGAFDGTAGGNPDVGPVTQLGTKLIFTGRFPGDPTFNQRRVYVIDTTQPDGPRLAKPGAPSAAVTPPPVVLVPPKPGVTTPPKTTPVTPKKSLKLGRKAKLRGSARVGQRLRVVRPTFRQKKVKLSFRWYAGKKQIKRQKKSSLKLSRSLKGKRISVKITARKSGYRTRTFTLKLKGKVRGRGK